MKIEFNHNGEEFRAPEGYIDPALDRRIMSREMEYVFQDICYDIKCGKTLGQILDHNGNIIGSWEL